MIHGVYNPLDLFETIGKWAASSSLSFELLQQSIYLVTGDWQLPHIYACCLHLRYCHVEGIYMWISIVQFYHHDHVI